jgi:hypothetical protein
MYTVITVITILLFGLILIAVLWWLADKRPVALEYSTKAAIVIGSISFLACCSGSQQNPSLPPIPTSANLVAACQDAVAAQDWDRATAACERIGQLDAELYSDIRHKLVVAYTQQAWFQLQTQSGPLTPAETLLLKALALDPADREAQMLLATVQELRNVSKTSVATQVSQQLARQPLGTLVFEPPQLSLGDTKTLVVTIRPGQEGMVQLASVQQNTAQTVANSQSVHAAELSRANRIRLTPEMTVSLTGEEQHFRIVSQSRNKQIVVMDQDSRWLWSVTPLNSGEHQLYVRVIPHVNLPDGDIVDGPEQVTPYAVSVQANLWYSVGQMIEKNPQWLAPTVLLPIVAAAWKLWSERKAKMSPDKGKH